MASKQNLGALPPPQWVVDLKNATEASPAPRSTNILDPPGFSETFSSNSSSKRSNTSKQPQPTARKPPTTEEMDTLKLKKAWEVAIGPAKQLPMNAIGMYMTGNSLQIFSIMMVFMMFKTPLQALTNINNTFVRFETEGTTNKLLLAKLTFVVTNLLVLSLGLWKVNKMGLLPTTRSDWLAWEAQRKPLERAYPASAI